VKAAPRLLLIDASESDRTVLGERLRLQGFVVTECADGAEGAVVALEDPPTAVVADLTMPSISGVQLCRLLGSEPGTSKVPVILRGAEGRRNHFWAEQAGAFAYVAKGRMGELVRALRRAIASRGEPDDFFVVASTQGLDVRERIATHLDAALFDSVVAAEVRRLGTSESFDRLADSLSQFVSQVTSYRWVALARHEPRALAVHSNPAARDRSISEARTLLGFDEQTPLVVIQDDDAIADDSGPPALCEPIVFGDQIIGRFVLAPRAPEHRSDGILTRTIARELGGALRMASLVEESRFKATTDSLTGLLNRRAFLDSTIKEVARTKRYGDTLSVVLLDIDHFKQINDHRGHAGGDAVLQSVGRLLTGALRSCDIAARWGGEEFVLVLPSTPLDGGMQVAERVRETLASARILDSNQELIPVTASFGVACYRGDESLEQVIDRADRAMYRAKSQGRNRVIVCDDKASETPERSEPRTSPKPTSVPPLKPSAAQA
jgi:diguanylate cyclase (GGDEF)-like protein